MLNWLSMTNRCIECRRASARRNLIFINFSFFLSVRFAVSPACGARFFNGVCCILHAPFETVLAQVSEIRLIILMLRFKLSEGHKPRPCHPMGHQIPRDYGVLKNPAGPDTAKQLCQRAKSFCTPVLKTPAVIEKSPVLAQISGL